MYVLVTDETFRLLNISPKRKHRPRPYMYTGLFDVKIVYTENSCQ